MDLQTLQYFLTVADYGSFSEAAEELYTTQSSVSKNIMSLEKELHLTLFDRSRRKIALTEAGELLLKDARQVVYSYEHMLHTVTDFQQKQRDTISILSIPVMAQYNITELIADFQDTYPNIQLDIRECEGARLSHQLAECAASFAFLRLEHLQSSYEYLPLFTDKLAVVLPSNHPLSNEAVLSLSQLSTENFLLLNQGTLLYDLIISQCEQHGFMPNITYTGSRMENILSLIGKDRGISLMMQHAASYLANDSVCIIPLDEDVTSTIVLACTKFPSGDVSALSRLSPSERIFWDYIKSNTNQLRC